MIGPLERQACNLLLPAWDFYTDTMFSEWVDDLKDAGIPRDRWIEIVEHGYGIGDEFSDWLAGEQE